jgi:4-oxalmesaconate hydratase
MIIDAHAHFTTTPPGVEAWRTHQQQTWAADPQADGADISLSVTDDEIREAIEPNQLATQRARGVDLTIFSPRANWMGHHIGTEAMSVRWSMHQNDLIKRVCDLYPNDFAPVAQLPQSPGCPLTASVREMRRCVEELGFIGVNINPDPSGGHWSGPPLFDRSWWPLWEAMCELQVPGMIHVSASCNPNFHTTGSHYLAADTTAFVQALSTGFLRDFPGLRLILPHGGGAVPYHWGRFRGMSHDEGWDFEHVLDHLWFDTCVYHQPGIDLLLEVVPTANIVFASELIGAVRGIDPETGYFFDDTKRYIDAAGLPSDERMAVLESNARTLFPRLHSRLDTVANRHG